MLGTQKSLKNIKKYLEGKAGSSMLSMKVLRYVLAVGFVLAPWLGGEAYADTGSTNTPPKGDIKFIGSDTNLIATGVAHIYAQDVDTNGNGKVGFNHFTTFKVENGEVANLYFQKDPNSPTLNALVNTVDNQISISGVVNGIRNNKIGGKLYFLSPRGMIVGSTGVINAGALTIVAPESISGITNANDAASKVVNNINWGPLAEDDTNTPVNVTINGKINTATGIDVQAMTVQIKKAEGSTINPTLLTGVVFSGAVNSGFSALPISSYRLQLTKDANGKLILDAADDVSVADPSNPDGSDDLIGNGMINIYSRRDLGSNVIGGKTSVSEAVLNAIGKVGIESGTAIEIDKSTTGTNTNNTSITSGYQIRLLAERSDFYNYGTISGAGAISLEAGRGYTANIINGGTIQSTDVGTSKSTAAGTTISTSGGIGITAHNSVTNEGTISASSQIIFSVPDSLTNTGTINSTGSNVHVHIGRNFKNNAVYGTDSSGNTVLKGGIITVGGNVQVDYTLPSGMTAVSTGSAIDGIYNSGLIQANGNVDPTYDAEGNIVSSGSGNIWLTSNYNIENTATGQMIANRQITLNARDFLDNYGLIQGVTYLDIKSIMGYVYNHGIDNNGNEMEQPGRIIATGGNIDLSSGQENLKIDNDTDGQKKENYRKFTPIIIEGIVQATSDDDRSNQTREGNIKITAYLGDIYINGGTIETKAEKSETGEVKAAAGDVILDAAQNITIGFKTEYAEADDPTTDNKYGDHPEYDSNTERGYYKPILDSNLVPSSPCDEPSTISGTNVTLSAGSINNKKALIGGNLTLDPNTKVKLEGSLTLQGNNMTVSGVQRSGNPSGALQVVANGVGGTDSAINSLNLNINDNLLFDKLNVNTADITVSGDLQINKLHVADLAHFTSNNTVVGVYGGSTTPSNDQSDALFRDLGNGSTTWMGLTISNGSYSVTNSTQISNSVENLAQMSAKLVDYTPQDSYNERYGDISGCFERYDIIEAPNRPTGGIAPTAESSGAELKQDENGLHIEMKNNNFEHEMDQRREQDKREGEKEA